MAEPFTVIILAAQRDGRLDPLAAAVSRTLSAVVITSGPSAPAAAA